MASIQRQLDCVTAAAADPDCPFFGMWAHASAGVVGGTFIPLQKRADFVQFGLDALDIAHARPLFNGWRTPK